MNNSSPTSASKQIPLSSPTTSPSKVQGSNSQSPTRSNSLISSSTQQISPQPTTLQTPTKSSDNLTPSDSPLKRSDSNSQSPTKISTPVANENKITLTPTEENKSQNLQSISPQIKSETDQSSQILSPSIQTAPLKMNSSDSIANNVFSPTKLVNDKNISFSPNALQSQKSLEFSPSKLDNPKKNDSNPTTQTPTSTLLNLVKVETTQFESSPSTLNASENAQPLPESKSSSPTKLPPQQNETTSPVKLTLDPVQTSPEKSAPQAQISQEITSPSKEVPIQNSPLKESDSNDLHPTSSLIKSPTQENIPISNSTATSPSKQTTDPVTQSLSPNKALPEQAQSISSPEKLPEQAQSTSQQLQSFQNSPISSPQRLPETQNLTSQQVETLQSPSKPTPSSPTQEKTVNQSFSEIESMSLPPKDPSEQPQLSPEKRVDTSFNPISNNESFQTLSLSTEVLITDITTPSNYNSHNNLLQTPNSKVERVDTLNKSPTFAKERDDLEEPIKITPKKMETPTREKYKPLSIKGKTKTEKKENVISAKALLLKSGNKGSASLSSHRRNKSSVDLDRSALDARLSIPKHQKSPLSGARSDNKALSTRTQDTKRQINKSKSPSQVSPMTRVKTEPASLSSYAKATQSSDLRSKEIALNLKTVSHERDESKEKEITFRKRSTDKKIQKLNFSASKNTSAFDTNTSVNQSVNISINQTTIIKESPEETKTKSKTKKYSSVLKNNLVRSINESILSTEKILNYSKHPIHKSPKKGDSEIDGKKKEFERNDSSLLIDVQPGFVCCDEIDMNMLKRIKKSLTLIEENMISYKSLSTIKILNRPHSSITSSTLGLICLLAGAFEEIPITFGKEVEEFDNSLWSKAKPFLQNTNTFINMLTELPKKIDKEFPDYENITIAKKYLEISKNLLSENPQVTGYIFVEEINKYIESVLDHVCLVREEGSAAQKILEKIETPAGNQITMIPFIEVPQERKKYYIFSDKKKPIQTASYYSTPEQLSYSSPPKNDKLTENKNSGLKLPNHNNISMYTDHSANSIQKIPEIDTETSKHGTSLNMTKSLEKSDLSVNLSLIKASNEVTHLQTDNTYDKYSSLFVRRTEINEESDFKKKPSRRNSQLEIIYSSLSHANPLPFGCPEMPALESSHFEHIENIDTPTQITVYSVSAFCCLFAGAVPELPKNLIQSKELPGKYRAVRDLYLKGHKKIDLIAACFHEFIREGLIDQTNGKEAQRIVKLYENLSRISPKKMEHASKENAIINFVKTGIQSFQFIEIRERQTSSNSHVLQKKENQARSITPVDHRPEPVLNSKNRVLLPNNSTPNTKATKSFNNYIAKVHESSCKIYYKALSLAARKENAAPGPKDFQKELEKKYGYIAPEDEEFESYASKKASSIKKELQKENNKPKPEPADKQSARSRVYPSLNKGENLKLSIIEKYGVLGQKLGEQRKNLGSSKKA